MSLKDTVSGLLRRHGSGIAFCGKVAARTLLPVGGERIASCLDALICASLFSPQSLSASGSDELFAVVERAQEVGAARVLINEGEDLDLISGFLSAITLALELTPSGGRRGCWA